MCGSPPRYARLRLKTTKFIVYGSPKKILTFTLLILVFRIKLLIERIKANEKKEKLQKMKQDGQFICYCIFFIMFEDILYANVYFFYYVQLKYKNNFTLIPVIY